MADDLTLNAGSGGATLATDEVAGGQHYQRVKLTDGTADSTTVIAAGDGASSGALRVAISSTLAKAEDAAHGSGDSGIMALAVRNDTLAALAGTDGYYAPLQVSADGALYVTNDNDLVDTNNSTTSTLTANTDYTGTGTDVLGYAGITVTVFADQDSDVNGMRFEFSSDNTNWDISQTFDYKASTGRQFQFGTQAQYFRVAFQNGGTNQTAFRLQTVLHRSPPAMPTVHRADADIAIDRSATLVKSILMAQAAGSGDFTPIDATTGGNLKVSLNEASDGLDIGAGNAGTETIRVSIATDDVNLSGILADTAAMDTNLATVAGAVAGSEMQVDIVSGTVTANLSATDNAVLDQIEANTSGNTSHYRNIDANAESEIKGSAGTLFWLHAMNLTAAKAYLHLYDNPAASVTPGTTTPDYTFALPTQGDTNGAGFVLPAKIEFTNGITLVCTTTLDGSAGDPGTNGVVVNAGYT